jgi:putative restriction endonuclease
MSRQNSQQTLIERFERLRLWQRRGERAVHKPLLVLLALSRLRNSNERWLRFSSISDDLEQLIHDFGPPRKRAHPEYPYWRLQNDGVWEVKADATITVRQGSTDALKSELFQNNATAGFSDPVIAEFKKHPEQIERVARLLLDAHFPDTVQADLIDTLQLNFGSNLRSRAARDPKFRAAVLSTYNYRCALCGYELRLGNELIGVEAAHIRWVQASGPDTTNNGIAFCTLHHKLFDRGAFSIEARKRVVACSKELIGRL